jgi:hypothetical protein|tara:strand:+ start:291 stop:635 length:345 start_codon:yes stop_codon:yes gene_type:complete
MTAEVEEDVNEGEEVVEESKIKPSDYSCEIILEKTTINKARGKKFPSDAYIIRYSVDGKDHIDLTRSGKQVNIFDMYYDRYGKDSIKAIEWGSGTIHPGMWGYKNPEKKKRRKG